MTATNNITDKKEYDWASGAPGALLRETKNTYETASAYLALNLVRLPTETKVLDGSGTLYSDTTYSYDQYGTTGITNCPNIVGHDNQNYAGGGTRGNASFISRYLNTNASWLTTTLAYDIAGNITGISDPNGHATGLIYTDEYPTGAENTHAHVTKLTNAKGQSVSWTWDYGAGTPLSATNLNQGVTTYAYDELSRLTETILPNGGTLNYVYPSTTETDLYQDQNTPGDRTLRTQTVSDGFGRAWQSNTYESATQYIQTTLTYDALGRVETTTNPSRQNPADGLGYATTYGYDSLSRLNSVITPDSQTAATSYSGNTVTAADQAGHARTSTIDGIGRLSQVVEDPGNLNYITSYTSDPLGNVRSVTQGSQTRTFVSDTLNRLTSAANPESGNVSYTYTYDGVGNPLTKTDPRGIVTTYTWDALNRPLTVSYTGGTLPVTYAYDAAANGVGQLTSVANGNSTTSFTAFDSMQGVLSSSQATAGQTYAFQYGYNLTEALTSETYPSGRVVTSGYDAANRPTTTSGSLNGQAKSYMAGTTYWPHGAVQQTSYGNNLYRNLGYVNARLQPTGYWDTIGENPNAFLRDEYPNWVNPTTQANNGTLQSTQIFAGSPAVWNTLPNLTQTFGYDRVNRLTSATESGVWSQTYNYDQYGNLWIPSSSLPAPLVGPGAPTSNVYNAGNNRNANSTYDAAGNLTVFGSVAVSYDAENRQTAAGVNSYLYDGVGQRVEKVLPSGTTVYAYDAFGQVAAEYTTAPAKVLCTTCYLSYDYLGSVRMVTDSHANVVARHDFSPFGQEIPLGVGIRTASPWGVVDNVGPKFTGQIRDAETGEDFFHARYLSSGLGRFMSVDPYNAGADITNPQSWNGYAYVGGQPLVYSDPTGEDFGGFLNWVGGLFGFGSSGPSYCLSFSGGGNCVGASNSGGAPLDPGFSDPGGGGGGGTGGGTGGGAPKAPPPKPAGGPAHPGATLACQSGPKSLGVGVGVGYNADVGLGLAGASSTGGLGGGLFHNQAAGAAAGYSGGGFLSSGALAYAGSRAVGMPVQQSSAFVLGAYVGAGANVFISNAASAQQLSGPFTTISINVGYEVANFGIQGSFGGGIWQVSITPPAVSVGFGAAASVIQTNTLATQTGCR